MSSSTSSVNPEDDPSHFTYYAKRYPHNIETSSWEIFVCWAAISSYPEPKFSTYSQHVIYLLLQTQETPKKPRKCLFKAICPVSMRLKTNCNELEAMTERFEGKVEELLRHPWSRSSVKIYSYSSSNLAHCYYKVFMAYQNTSLVLRKQIYDDYSASTFTRNKHSGTIL